MSTVFDAYDQDFKSLSRDIQQGLSDLKNGNNEAGKVSSIVKSLDALFHERNDLLKQIEIEVRGHDSATRKILSEKLSTMKKSSNKDKSEFEKCKEKAERSNLIGTKSQQDRQRLLDTNDK